MSQYVIVMSYHDRSGIIATFGPFPDKALADHVAGKILPESPWVESGLFEVFELIGSFGQVLDKSHYGAPWREDGYTCDGERRGICSGGPAHHPECDSAPQDEHHNADNVVHDHDDRRQCPVYGCPWSICAHLVSGDHDCADPTREATCYYGQDR